MVDEDIKEKIHSLVKEYMDRNNTPPEKVTVGWPCYDHQEINSAINSFLDLRLSQGSKVRKFEEGFSNYVGMKYGVAVNSGSSANLIALRALLQSGRIKPGSEVIVPAATFTTVISPILQNGLKPVFVDVDETYNMDPSEVEKAISEETSLIMVVHSLGCPANMERIMDIAEKSNVLVIEDCCEAHGASVNGKKVGSFGVLSMYSFFVAHNITTGEGGMVLSNEEEMDRVLRSIREFGRHEVDKDKPRFYYTDEELTNYDERYVFELSGYNVRMTDINASLGIEQLKKLDELNDKRIDIVNYYNEHLKEFSEYLQLPVCPDGFFHSYYGYTLKIKKNDKFERKDLVRFLEEKGIETRAFMGGNLAKQPAYRKEGIRTVGNLENTDALTENAFFIGCHALISREQRELVVDSFKEFFSSVENE